MSDPRMDNGNYLGAVHLLRSAPLPIATGTVWSVLYAEWYERVKKLLSAAQ